MTPTRRRKRLGQHFLVDRNIARYQVSIAEIEEGDVVLEIGGGHGALTDLLVQTPAFRIYVFEKDTLLAGELRARHDERHGTEKTGEVPGLGAERAEEVGWEVARGGTRGGEVEGGDDVGWGGEVERTPAEPRVRIIRGDALKVPWPEFDVFVSNIPYTISSPLTFKLIEKRFRRAVVMYQWEFARRLVAGPGEKEYSRIGVKVQYGHHVTLARKVPRTAFSPPPRVDSAIVVIEPRDRPAVEVADEKLFFEVVDVLFRYRRKKIENALALGGVVDDSRRLSLPPDLAGKRVDSLPMEELARLSNWLHEHLTGRTG